MKTWLKKILSAALAITAVTAHASNPPVLWEGNFVRTLLPYLNLNGTASLLQGSSDPTSVAISAPAGSLYLRTNGKLYTKTDAGLSTNWAELITTSSAVATTRTISTTAPLTGGGDLSANRTFAITQAATGADGYLSSTDWNTFNNKVSTSRSISTTAPLTGGGDLSSNRTIAMPAAASGTDGYLTGADWATFNGKQAAGNYVTALTGDVTASGPGSVAATVAAVGGETAAAVATATGVVNTAQSGRKFLASPSDGSSGAASFRAIVAADVPTLNQSTTGNAATATALAANPSDCAANNYATAIDASGNLTCSTVAAPTPVVQSKTTTYTILSSDDVILASGSAFTLTLPSASTAKKIQIKKTDASLSNIITIARAGSDTIEGGTSTTLNTLGETITLVSDGGTAWQILSRDYDHGWYSFTMTIEGSGSNPSRGTGVTEKAYWRRVGKNMEIMWSYDQTGAGTAGTGDYKFVIPGSQVIDTTYLSAASDRTGTPVGVARMNGGSNRAGVVIPYTSVALAMLVGDSGNDPFFIGQSGGGALNNANQAYEFKASVPIEGWN